MSRPSKMIAPPVASTRPEIASEQRRLARAVRPEQRDDLALVDLEVDVEQDLHRSRSATSTPRTSSSLARPCARSYAASDCAAAAVHTRRMSPATCDPAEARMSPPTTNTGAMSEQGGADAVRVGDAADDREHEQAGNDPDRRDREPERPRPSAARPATARCRCRARAARGPRRSRCSSRWRRAGWAPARTRATRRRRDPSPRRGTSARAPDRAPCRRVAIGMPMMKPTICAGSATAADDAPLEPR